MFYAQRQPRIDCFQRHALIWVIESVKMLFALFLVYGKDEVRNLKEENEIEKTQKFDNQSKLI